MNSSTFVILLLNILLKHCSSVDIHVFPQDFCYTDPSCGPKSSVWKPLCHKGQSQSPINLEIPLSISQLLSRSKLGLGKFSVKITTLPEIKLQSDHFFIQNDGHTINLDFTSFYDINSNSRIFPGHGLTKTQYRFANAHFHWGRNDSLGSEHRINGQSYSMELHLVHYNSKYRTLKQAVHSGDPDALAVVALLFQVVPNKNPHPSLAPVIKSLKFVRHKHWYWAKIEENPLDFSPLIPKASRVFRYKGSLTTPDCFEPVNWFVFEQPVAISSADVRAFRMTEDGRGEKILENCRPIQSQNQREIEVIYLV